MEDPYEKPLRIDTEGLHWPVEDVAGDIPKSAFQKRKRSVVELRNPDDPVSATFARTHQGHMAYKIATSRRRLSPFLNEYSLFTKAATFGDTNDLYYHSPTNRIGSNYAPTSSSAASALFEHDDSPKDPDWKVRDTKLRESTTARAPLGMIMPRMVTGRPNAGTLPAPPAGVAPAGRPLPPGLRSTSPDSPLEDTVSWLPEGAEVNDRDLTDEQRRMIADAILRYYYYIDHGIRDEEIAPPNERWLIHVLQLVPQMPPPNVSEEWYGAMLDETIGEMEEDYRFAMKRAIVDYTLTSATERERLGLEVLAPILPALPRDPGPRVPTGSAALPPEWRAAVNEAREDVAWTLQTLSPNALELAALWESFNLQGPNLLVDVKSPEFSKDLPFDMDDFRGYQTNICETRKQMLWQAWVPRSAEVFRRMPPVCINADSEAYYRSIATLQSNQLRQFVKDSLDVYVAFFESHAPRAEVDPHSANLLWSVPSAFKVQLKEEEGEYVFSPPFQEVSEMVHHVMEQFVVAVQGIPRVGSASGAPSRRSAHIPAMSQEEDAVVEAAKRVQYIMSSNTEAPEMLSQLFEKYKYLLAIDAAEHVKAFYEEDHVLDDYAAEIDKFKQAASDIENEAQAEVRTGLYLVDCEPLKTKLADQAMTIAEALLSQVRSTVEESNKEICEAYEEINRAVQQVPDTGDAVLALKKYIAKCQTEIETLQNEINANVKSEEFLNGYFFAVPDADFQLSMRAYEWPKKIVEIMKNATNKANAEHRAFEDALKKRRGAFTETLMLYEADINAFDERGEPQHRDRYAGIVQDLNQKLIAAQEEADEINAQEALFNWAKTKFTQVPVMVSKLDPFLTLWSISSDFYNRYGEWMNGPFSKLNPEEVDEIVNDMYRRVFKLTKMFAGAGGAAELPAPLSVAVATKEKIEKFKEYIPLISAICNPGLRQRHWKEMTDLVGFTLEPDGTTSLARLLDRKVDQHMAKIEELSDFASREWSIEKMLDKMVEDWGELAFELKDWKATGSYILGGGPVDEAQILLDDHIVKTQAMSASPFAKPFEERIQPWLVRLVRLQDILDQWLKCQGKWIYLEPIFSAEEIMRQIPTEGKAFAECDKIWRAIMAKAKETPRCLHVADFPGLLEDLTAANNNLDVVEKGLNAFLDTKKMAFPRFYFLSNDELLEILSECKDPIKVQPFVKKCFEAMKELVFQDDGRITGMVSGEGEKVDFPDPVNPAESGAVEVWLLGVERQMKRSLLKVAGESLVDYRIKSREEWILKWPGQLVLNVSQVFWTQEVTDAINQGGAKGLATYGDQCTKQLNAIVSLVRGELTSLERSTCGALVVIDVHARDVVVQMAEDGVSDERDFKWLSQLRYFWEHDEKIFNEDTLVVRMINAQALYGYEYLGNSGRLVITPLTDRCYRTLMGAIHLCLGGAPAGPAGTGKTETTKDLSKAIAIQCVVFNCSDGLDYKAMGKFFKGLACSGAWACFDEFNRIELEVLSVVAQQVLTIQRAVAANAKKFMFEGVELSLNPTCNVFITMNPGYAGRSELPDNLKALFRDVAMMVPDYAMIAEIILYSFGYLEARSMARKLVQTYRLCSEQLSSQDHYDYGMRAVISVLRAAGNLKRTFKEQAEDILMLRAITDVNLPKFLDQDVPLFQGILSDLFPGVKLPEADYSAITEAMTNQCKKLNLQPLPTFFVKIIQLYEMIIVRHGLMVVGLSFGMKTSAIRVLKGALDELNEKGLNDEKKTKIVTLNPKSVTMGQLYGQEDPVSKEWTDGVLAVLFRNMARDTSDIRKWVVFDGPVDAIWIENMNTVLDDNKKLCLNSGEIVAMSGLMNMIFEVADLAVASPATVSRCGMVYVQPSLLGWRPTMVSWITTLPEGLTSNAELRDHVVALFDWLVPPCLRVITKECKMMVPMQDINLVGSLMRLYESLLDEFKDKAKIEEMNENMVRVWLQSLFLFSLVWSVGGCTDDDGRKKFDSMLRKFMVGDIPAHIKPYCKGPAQKITQLFPEGKSVYEWVFDKSSGKWMTWMDTMEKKPLDPEAEYTTIIVPTMDTVRYTYLLDVLATHNKHMMLVGPTGTGKSVYIKKHLVNGLDQEKFAYMLFNFSAQTSVNMTQDIIDGKLDKRRKGVYGPPPGKEMVIFVDDLNMPQVEEYGAQPPIELLRQFMDHGGWYDRKELTLRKLVDVQFVAAMGPPGGGRNSVTNRYLRHFSCVSATAFDKDNMGLIFTSLMDWFMKKFDYPEKVTKMKKSLVDASIEVYETVQRELLPTPSKSHYTFNLRDLSKVFQGVCAAGGSIDDAQELSRLWIHEMMRVFHDRLINDEDREWIGGVVETTVEKHFKEKFHKLLGRLDMNKDNKIQMTELRYLLFGDFMIPGADPMVYDEITDVDKMMTVVNEYLSDFNATSKRPMHLVMFLYALEHISRICRVIKQPGGHALLVGLGGSGRQSLTRLAAFIEEFDVFQIEITKNYGINEWHDDLRKVLKMAGESNKKVVFLFSDTQIKTETYVEDISNILNTYEVPNLLDGGDLATIFENIRPRAKQTGMDGSRGDMYNFFLGEVKKNLHIVLSFSPVGDEFRERLRRFPSLVTCCTIDWFSAWPRDALATVAQVFLAEVNVEESVKKEVMELAVIMHESVHKLAQRFLDEQRRHFYVTPTSYLELISLFKNLLEVRQTEVSKFQKRYEVGLEKLAFTEEQVKGMQEELEALQPQLIASGKETEAAMEVIARETIEADKVKAVVSKEEASASAEAAKVQAIKDDCETQLGEAMPMLEAALRALDTLSKNDITEVKGMKSPPAPVKIVMEAVCILKGLKPARVKDTQSGKMVDDFWETSKKMVSESNFLDALRTFDKDNIPPAIIAKIRPYVANPEFDPQKIKQASTAAYGLCCWVRAMEAYDRVAKIVAPKKEALGKAETELEKVMSALRIKQAELQKVVDKLNALDTDLQAKKDKKAKLEADVELCKLKLDRAEKLISGLGGEKTRWTAAAERLAEQFTSLTGDVLVSAGMIAYLGPFTAGYRKDVVGQWTQECIARQIPCSEGKDGPNLIDVLGDPVAIRQWNIHGLPRDDFSSENGIIMFKGRRWPLMIDPQGLANKFVRTMEAEHDLKVIKLTDSDYVRTLETAVQFGKPVLLENVGETLDATLEPLLLKQVFKQGGANCIKMGDSVIEYSDKFRFYITTKLRNPHYAPELCVKVSLLNFMTTPEGLQDQLLGTVVSKERPDLEEEKNKLIIEGAENKKKLKEIEDRILEVLSNSEGNILEDEGAVQVLSASKVLSDEISEKQAIAEVTERKIDEARVGYEPVAKHSTILFFSVADMANIDPMYQYSLNWFSGLFLRSIGDSTKSDDLAERLQLLNDYFTFFLYTNVCRSLFEKDKLLFAVLLCSKLQIAEGKMDPAELRFLLTGGVAMDNPHPNPAPTWLTEKMWGEVCRATELPSGAFAGLRDLAAEDPNLFKKIFDSSEPDKEPLPGVYKDKLNVFQKILVLRAIRPDKVVPALSHFVADQMGKRFVEPMPFDITPSYNDSACNIPLIFVLSPGSDPMANLLKFADDRKVRVEAVSLGQGQGPVAQKWIDQAVEEGFWVVLQNCHLAKSFLPQLEMVCEQQLVPGKINENFRLWLTSYPSTLFPISILESGVKMTNEPPKGLRAGVLRTFMSDPISDPEFFSTCTKDRAFRKMLYGLAFFHSFLQERRKFGPIGWNIPYEFNENDLRICVRQLKMFLDEYEEPPFETLRYTAGECNYGGKVTDGHDRHTLMTILEIFYNEQILDDGYKISPSGIYKVPQHGDYKSYLDAINQLPMMSSPEVFGLHDNADITKDIGDTNLLLDSFMLTQSRDTSGGGKSGDEVLSEVVNDIIKRWPPNFDLEAAEIKYPVDYYNSMNTVLVQELGRVNVLLQLVRNSLVNLGKAIKGEVLMSADLDTVGKALSIGKIPSLWLKKSFPSLKPLASYVKEVIERYDFFNKWLQEGNPTVYWISGFFFTQAFLTGAKQNFARRYTIPIDQIDFDFEVMDREGDCESAPDDGVFVDGLFIEGARWDFEEHVIGESEPKVLYTSMPKIHFVPAETTKFKKFKNYNCPIYKTAERRGILSTTGHSTNFVMDIRIASSQDPSWWTKRGVALLTSLLD